MTNSTPGRETVVNAITEHGVVVVVRADDPGDALRTIEAVREGGLRCVELSTTSLGALRVLEEVARKDPELVVGVTSVLDAETTRAAVEAGARFVASTVFLPEVVEEAHRLGVPVMPGAFTPTEILHAHAAGADMIRVFPADVLGPSFFSGILAAMPSVRLMPTGGVTPENAGSWLKAGASAIGIGRGLLDPALLAADRYDVLTARAQRLRERVADARRTQR